MLLNLLFENPLIFVVIASSLVVSLTIHEFAHAYVASILGDPSPKMMGRVSLNPMRHLDPLGTVMLLLAGFGWGKPVLVNDYNFKHPRRDMALVALAGPISNLTLATITAFLIRFVFVDLVFISSILSVIVYYNLILCFFNLIPVPPLDGFKVIGGFLPLDFSVKWYEFEKYGVYVLLIMFMTGATSKIITPFVGIAMKILGVAF